ncbi:MAG TPA: tetratricopeptide repeat protein [Bacteroidales bacterium]|nr:tetratricopeptide repeat protein [Bacteroidales bacterium]
MITSKDINTIFSTAYANASLAENCDMRLVADLFESVRGQLHASDPIASWEYLILDRVKFNSEYALQQLIDLKDTYFGFLCEKILTHLDTTYKKDKKAALSQWYGFYADAAVHYRNDLLCMLSHQRKKWGIKDVFPAEYSKLAVYIRESRWPDAYPFYEEIAADSNLPAEIRAYAEITLLEIVLYYFPESANALKHIENAHSLLPGHFMTIRGEAVYHMRTGEIQKARNGFLQAIAMKPGDYFSMDLIGDCFLTEGMLDDAESWYNEAIKVNFMQPDSYHRLLNLYGNKTWFPEKETLMGDMLLKIEKRTEIRNVSPLIGKKMAREDCFINLLLYESYRDVAAAWYAIQNYEKAEEWYLKAKALHPGIASALIDLAYVKQQQELPDEVLKYFREAGEKDRNHFDAYWGLAIYYKNLGQKSESLSNYRKCLRLRPSWSDWVNNFIGNLYYSLKDYKNSETYYRKSVALNGDYSVYRQNLAGALVAQADKLNGKSGFAKAEKLYLEAAAIDNDANRWNTAGNFYYKSERWEEAGDCYDQSIALKSTEPVFYENRGLVFEHLALYDEAEQAFKTALGLDKETGRYYNRLGVFYYNRAKYSESVTWYLEALERMPKEPVYLDNLCLAYEQMKEPDLAEPYYLRLLEIEPANDRVMNQLGVLFFKRKNYEKALEYYNNAIQLNSGNSVYFENLSALYRDLRQFSDGIEALQQALRLQPQNDVILNNIGVFYFDMADYDKALEYYNQALALKPRVLLYYENIAAVYELKQQYAEAVHYYNKALKFHSKNAKIYAAMGLVYYNWKQYEPAIASYREAVALDENNGIYQAGLGMALMASGEKDEAMTVYQRAVTLSDNYYISWNDLGVLHYEKGNFDEAIACYNKSIRLQPNDPVLYVNLALAFYALGKTKEAREITGHSLLNHDVRKQVESMLQKSIPYLFELKN